MTSTDRILINDSFGNTAGLFSRFNLKSRIYTVYIFRFYIPYWSDKLFLCIFFNEFVSCLNKKFLPALGALRIREKKVKGTVSREFRPLAFFHQTILPWPLINGAMPCCIYGFEFAKIFEFEIAIFGTSGVIPWIRGLGGILWWKKPEVENLVTLSLSAKIVWNLKKNLVVLFSLFSHSGRVWSFQERNVNSSHLITWYQLITCISW
jgi:hypothetical protein